MQPIQIEYHVPVSVYGAVESNRYQHQCTVEEFLDAANDIFQRVDYDNSLLDRKYIPIKYLTLLWNFVTSIVNNARVMPSTNYDSLLKPQNIYERFLRCTKLPKKPNSKNYINEWGVAYWRFLHLGSILSTRSDELVDFFAGIVLNFEVMIPCSMCAKHYVEMDPANSLLVPILRSRDPITAIYNLHNRVNRSRNVPNFPFHDFLALYKLNAVDMRSVLVEENDLNVVLQKAAKGAYGSVLK